MIIIIRKVTFLVGLTLCVIVLARGQVVTSVRDGLWNDPTTWDSGLVPDVASAIETVVNHNVLIPDLASIAIRNVVVAGSLTVGVGAVVDIQPDAMPERKDLQVFGSLVMSDGATLNGSSASNTSFESGARYIHLQGPLGFIPYATWDPNSIFEISGFRTQGYINIAHSDSWKQNFGHVIYNCSQQTTAFVDLNGYLRNIAGNFTILNTNNQVLRLSTTQNPVITVAGDLIIQGSSKFWLSTTPSNAVVNVAGDFRYISTSTGISYLTTKGVAELNVSGEFEMDSPGRIQMASISPDSTGARIANLNLYGDLTVSNGTIIGPPSPGKGTIRFAGIGVQAVTTAASGINFSGNIDYIIETDAFVDLGTSVLSNTTGSLQVNGTLLVGSTHSLGAIQTAAAGNIQVQGSRTFQPGATIEYNGLGPQWIGDGHPATPGVNLICNNPSGVTLLNDITTGDLSVLDDLDTQLFPVTADGNIFVMSGVNFNPRDVNLVGSNEQQISVFGARVDNITVNKTANAVELTSQLNLRGNLLIQSANTALHSNGQLILLSTSDEIGGTASVGPLPPGSSITGDVTVQRHMAGEGRIFRYISSPVQNSTVASLQDDFPVAGKFADPSGNSTNPSFYYYDQSVGGLAGGWRPYPSSGLASANPLVVGKGYCTHIRKASGSTIWDVTGPLNQGTIELPIDFSPNNQPSNGWNLVGNPYACAIQWDEVAPDKWSMHNISSVIAIRDNGTAGGIFRYWDLDNNYSETAGQIASGQSFWVRATGPGASLTIREGVKAPEGATFYRTDRARIPSFAVTLSNGSVSDVAYYKIRPSASSGLDDWDGVKLDNALFDLSFATADNVALAIHATNRLPCDTIIPLNMKDLTAGRYFLQLSARYHFTRYSYSLLDNYRKTETVLDPEVPVSFEVTSSPASSAVDRLSLRLRENPPRNDLRVTVPTAACEDEVVGVKISGAESGVKYSIHTADSIFLSSGTNDSNGDLVISFPASALKPGKNILSVKANATCHVVPLLGVNTIIRESTPHIWVEPVTACSGSTVILEASCDKKDARFLWFSEPDLMDTVGFEASFQTRPLTKSKTYYVIGSAGGCLSDLYEVKATVTDYETAGIMMVADSLLASNYVFNNVWMIDGDTIDEVRGQFLPLENPGIYTLITDTLGCVSTATFEYLPLQSGRHRGQFYAYPNPASEILMIGTPTQKEGTVDIVDGQGKLVKGPEKLSGRDEHPVVVRELAEGIYFVLVTASGIKRMIRFIKED